MEHRPTNDERLAAAHAALTEAIAKVATSDDWQRLLSISRSFHRYSAGNQLLLAAQGAEGIVGSFNTFKKITATDGQPCSVRKGETALRVYAPMQTVRREVDQDTGDEIEVRGAVRYKLVPVFHQGQLVSPPDLPVQPKLLDGVDPPVEVWDAVAAQIAAAGFTLERGPLDGPDGPKGTTNYTTRVVTVRDDLSPVQSLKTGLHELAHCLRHTPEQRGAMTRDRIEVEAESIAYVVMDTLGIDSAEYSIPYVANWAGADVDLVRSTAERVLTTARTIVGDLEQRLGVELTPDPLASVRRRLDEEGIETSAVLPAAAGRTTDQLVADHLSGGTVDWPKLAASIPAVETHRAAQVIDDPIGQAIVVAEAGATAPVAAALLRTHGMTDAAVQHALVLSVPDALGESPTLYPVEEVTPVLNINQRIESRPDELIADLIVAVGRHPSATLHLAQSGSQTATVISLVEERLRRTGPLPVHGSPITSPHRGLALIDDWATSPAPTGAAPHRSLSQTPSLPDPPCPPAA